MSDPHQRWYAGCPGFTATNVPRNVAQTFPPALSAMFFQISYANEMAAAAFLGIIPPAILALIFQSRIKRLNIADPLG